MRSWWRGLGMREGSASPLRWGSTVAEPVKSIARPQKVAIRPTSDSRDSAGRQWRRDLVCRPAAWGCRRGVAVQPPPEAMLRRRLVQQPSKSERIGPEPPLCHPHNRRPFTRVWRRQLLSPRGGCSRGQPSVLGPAVRRGRPLGKVELLLGRGTAVFAIEVKVSNAVIDIARGPTTAALGSEHVVLRLSLPFATAVPAAATSRSWYRPRRRPRSAAVGYPILMLVQRCRDIPKLIEVVINRQEVKVEVTKDINVG
mmetsp:Transcript_2754/g.5937  ORF Transcript_2754/g.5937 Transcript_2754/m.5937 type:complete len:255 (-) Transcript_2754:218-982(-)